MGIFKNVISTSYFYESHFSEISKYLNKEKNYLNLINNKSNIPEGLFDNVIKFSSSQPIEKVLENLPKNIKYDLIVLTDIFDLSNDIYTFLKEVKNILNLKEHFY